MVNLSFDNPKSDIVIYQSENGETKIGVRFEDETVWLTQAQLCELYQSSKANVSEHIKNIFEEGELEENSVVRKIRTTAADGKSYAVNHYNLDMIISLGYRIKSSIVNCSGIPNNCLAQKPFFKFMPQYNWKDDSCLVINSKEYKIK